MGEPPQGWPLPEDWLRAASRPLRAARVDPSVPNVARVWDSITGGHDNFEADRSAARLLLAASPVMRQLGPASRAFLRRVVTYLVAKAGITQFIDIGTGMPAPGNVHSLAQAVDRTCRVVYVDNDPVVLSHVRAWLRSPDDGAVSCFEADVRDTPAVLGGVRQALDLSRPVGVLMTMVLNFVEDAGGAQGRLIAALPSGSYLAVAHPARDNRLMKAARLWNEMRTVPVFLRDFEDMSRWMFGLDLAEPGIVEVHRWRPAPGDLDYPEGMPVLGAVARKR